MIYNKGMNTQRGFIKTIILVIILVILVSTLTDFDVKTIWTKIVPALDFIWGMMLRVIGLVIDATLYILDKVGIGR